jgi:hypothetical protein
MLFGSGHRAVKIFLRSPGCQSRRLKCGSSRRRELPHLRPRPPRSALGSLLGVSSTSARVIHRFGWHRFGSCYSLGQPRWQWLGLVNVAGKTTSSLQSRPSRTQGPVPFSLSDDTRDSSTECSGCFLRPLGDRLVVLRRLRFGLR